MPIIWLVGVDNKTDGVEEVEMHLTDVKILHLWWDVIINDTKDIAEFVWTKVSAHP